MEPAFRTNVIVDESFGWERVDMIDNLAMSKNWLTLEDVELRNNLRKATFNLTVVCLSAVETTEVDLEELKVFE